VTLSAASAASGYVRPVDDAAGPKILTAMLGNRTGLVLLLSAVATAFGVTGVVLCVVSVQRLGIRRLAVLGFAVTSGCLAVISGAYPLLAILVATVLIWVYYAGRNFGLGHAGTAMGSLSYPANIQGISGGCTRAITRVGGIIGAYAFPGAAVGGGAAGHDRVHRPGAAGGAGVRHADQVGPGRERRRGGYAKAVAAAGALRPVLRDVAGVIPPNESGQRRCPSR
jgi:hypothetical protein